MRAIERDQTNAHFHAPGGLTSIGNLDPSTVACTRQVHGHLRLRGDDHVAQLAHGVLDVRAHPIALPIVEAITEWSDPVARRDSVTPPKEVLLCVRQRGQLQVAQLAVEFRLADGPAQGVRIPSSKVGVALTHQPRANPALMGTRRVVINGTLCRPNDHVTQCTVVPAEERLQVLGNRWMCLRRQRQI